MSHVLLFMLAQYQRWISPLLGAHCRFHPSCSDYARQAIERHGSTRGSVLTLWRLARCQPWCEGGMDPVPERFRFVPCGHHHDQAHDHD